MNEERQAQLLAAWLDAPEGSPAPEGLDPDVVEAMYVLRPELAPGPRMSAEDLLASLDAGSAGPPGSVEQGEVIDLAARRRRLWYGAGVAAVAAMALIVIVPVADELDGRVGLTEATEQAAPAPRASAGDLVAAEEEPVAELPHRELLDELERSSELASREEPAGGERAQLRKVAEEAAPEAKAPREAAPASPPVDYRAAMKRSRAGSATGSTLALPEPEGGAGLDGAPLADAELDAGLADEDRADDAFAGAPTARFEDWKADTGLGAGAPGAAPEEQEAAVAQEQAAEKEETANLDATVASLEARLASADARVGQQAAAQAAELLFAAGRLDEALAILERGRALSTADSALLSRLWSLEARIHEARGDLERAAAASAEAEALDAVRSKETSAY